MSEDISQILRDWPFDPVKTVRKVVGDDGSVKLQVRLPLGLEQYELDGRPDGFEPEGHKSYLDLYEARLEDYRKDQGSDDGYKLATEDCAHLRQEGMLYYFRYLLCFQIGEYAQVQDDTQRNMRLFTFVHDHAELDDDRHALDQYWPYIIRMNAMARGMELVQQDDFSQALSVVTEALERIDRLAEVDTETFSLEKMRSIGVLKEMAEELRQKSPPDERELVRQRLKKAVAVENYERAAQLRDLLRSMGE